ncbi:MAG: hypothetical protein L6V81_08550 [Clostridium sp.]|nr:MAG: hypothetical protein L6V81_08550 [Clostridium sp.]
MLQKCYDEKNIVIANFLKINEIDINKIIDELEKNALVMEHTNTFFIQIAFFYLNDKNKLLSLPSISDKSKYIEYKNNERYY